MARGLRYLCVFMTFLWAGYGFGETRSFAVSSHCDLADANLSSRTSETVEDCQKACQAEANCPAFVYVSGWKRCFFKASAEKKKTIRFYSGDVIRDAADKHPRLGESGYDQDHSGKDLKREVLKTHQECSQQCLANQSCYAFTFIEGYDVCWLKAAGGRRLPKIFYCGIPKQ